MVNFIKTLDYECQIKSLIAVLALFCFLNRGNKSFKPLWRFLILAGCWAILIEYIFYFPVLNLFSAVSAFGVMLSLTLIGISRFKHKTLFESSYFTSLLFMVLLAASLLGVPYPKTAPDNLQDGKYHFKSGNYESAIASLNKSISKNPSLCEAYYYRAYAYGKIEKYDEAIADCDKAVELKPDDTENYFLRAYVYTLRSDKLLEHAVLDYSKCVELNPQYQCSFYNMANIKRREGEFTDAITYYTKAINTGRKSACCLQGCFFNRGLCFSYIGDNQKAILDYTQALDLVNDDTDALLERGYCYFLLKDYEKAISDFQEALKIDPSLKYACSNMGIVLLETGKPQEALEKLTQAINLAPDFAEAYYLMAQAYAALGDLPQAESHAKKAEELGYHLPDNFIETISKPKPSKEITNVHH